MIDTSLCYVDLQLG